MAGNGNAPDPRVEAVESAILQAKTMRDLAKPAAKDDETYDLAARANDTAQAMRDLARYSNQVADDLERVVAMYIGHMNRLLGKMPK